MNDIERHWKNAAYLMEDINRQLAEQKRRERRARIIFDISIILVLGFLTGMIVFLGGTN